MSQVKIEDTNDYTVLHLIGNFSGGDEEIESLRNTFKELSKQNKQKIAIDLGEVNYLASAALGALLSGNSIITKIGGKIVLFNASEYLNKIFNITKLTLTFKICNSLEEALAAF